MRHVFTLYVENTYYLIFNIRSSVLCVTRI